MGISKNSIRHICNHLPRHGLWTEESPFATTTTPLDIFNPRIPFIGLLWTQWKELSAFPSFLSSPPRNEWVSGSSGFLCRRASWISHLHRNPFRAALLEGCTRSPTRNLIYSVKLDEIWQGSQREYLRVANQQQINAFPTFSPLPCDGWSRRQRRGVGTCVYINMLTRSKLNGRRGRWGTSSHEKRRRQSFAPHPQNDIKAQVYGRMLSVFIFSYLPVTEENLFV